MRLAFVRTACAVLLLGIGANALSLAGRRMIGRYDFGYAMRGDASARPAQVFDDGAGKVYFQPRPGRAMPAVFAGKDLQLLVLQPEGQYFTARTGASDFTLALGAARASVRRGDAALGSETLLPVRAEAGRLLASADPGLPAGVDFGAGAGVGSDDDGPLRLSSARWNERRLSHEQPIVFAPGSASLRPDVRAALSALAVRIGRGTPVVIDGRGDAGRHDALSRLRADALRRALLACGVATVDVDEAPFDDAGAPASASAASTIRWTSQERGPLPPESSASTADFEIDPTDRDIAEPIRRWARASGYDVVWDVRWTAPVDGTLHLETTSFLDAVRQVVGGLRAQGYPVQAQAYADRVVRFTSTP